MSEKKSNSLPGWPDMTAEELEERIRNGPSEQEIAEHFGYKQLLEGGSRWFNDPGNAERLLSGLPELLRQYGPDKCYRIIFDYDPDYPNMLLQVSVHNPNR